MDTPSHFLSSFNKAIRKKLILEGWTKKLYLLKLSKTYQNFYFLDFWIKENPCYWTILNYLQTIIKKDPTTSRRNASLTLLADAKIIKENVVAGTVAETKVNAMLNYTKVSSRFVFIVPKY